MKLASTLPFVVLAFSSPAFAASGISCEADPILSIEAKVTFAPDAIGSPVTLTVFDNYWHPKALRCLDVAAGPIVSTCQGGWDFLTDAAKYKNSAAVIFRSAKGYEVAVTSNTFSKIVTLACERSED